MATNPFNVEFNYFHENSLDYKNKLCQWILSNKKGYIAHLKRNHSKLIDYLNSNFIQLNQHSLSEKLYWFIYQINEFPMCKTCVKHVVNIQLSLDHLRPGMHLGAVINVLKWMKVLSRKQFQLKF